MSRFNTGNPIGSADPRDRDDNSKNLDEAVNDLNSDTWIDRFGVERKTWSSIEKGIEEQLIAGGRIFDSEAQGRAAVENDQYYYAVSDNPNVSKTLWKRVSATESEFIADDPSAIATDRAIRIGGGAEGVARRSSSAPSSSFRPAPYMNFGDVPAQPVLVDFENNILPSVTEAIRERARTAVLPRPTPYMNFGDDFEEAQTDSRGVIIPLPIDIHKIKQNLPGIPAPTPYVDFDDDAGLFLTDEEGNLVSGVGEVNSDASFPSPDEMYADVNPETMMIEATWSIDDVEMRRTIWGPNGHNDLFNFRRMYKAPHGSVESAPWSLIQAITTDWLPPVTTKVAENGDGKGFGITGGNHGSSGGSGLRTATMTRWAAFVDGVPVENPFAGTCKRVVVEWSNDIMSWNTMTLERYALRQDFVAVFTRRSVEIICDMTALEPIYLGRINGCAVSMRGWQDSAHFYGGLDHARIPYDADSPFNSGPWEQAPGAWGTSIYSAENGYMLQWTDREYGIGKPENIDAGLPLQFTSVSKSYQRLITPYDDEFLLDTGQTVSWHGGYAWATERTQSGDIDSAFLHQKNGVDVVSFAQLAGGEGKYQPFDNTLTALRAGTHLHGPTGFRINNPAGYISESLTLNK